MSAQPAPTSLQLAHLRERSRAAGEDATLLAMRERAQELLAPLQLPERARHLWKYTDPRTFVPTSDPTVTIRASALPSWHSDDPLAGAALIAGGALRLHELDEAARRAGVEVLDLHRADVGDLLGRAVPATHGFVEALNMAAWAGGVLVRVPPGVRLEHPLRVRIAAGAAGSVSAPRLLVVAGEGSSFELVEGHAEGSSSASQVLGVTEILIGAGADVRYGVVQRWKSGVIGHLTLRALGERGARFQLSLDSFGGKLFKADVGAVLTGEHAEAETFGVAMGGDTQSLDHHTEHIHLAPKTRSNLDFKVALTAAARSAYTGMIRIARDAGGSEAYQENRNLLLSDRARADSIPELEILTDDVRCSHGATVAPLGPEQLFYLQSRGLPPNQAMRVIVYGFLDQTLQRLPERTRERIEALVANRLHAD